MFFIFGSEAFGLFSILFLIALVIWAIYYFILRPKMVVKCSYCNGELMKGAFFCPYCVRLLPIEDIKKLVNRFTYQIKVQMPVCSIFPTNESELSDNTFFIKSHEIVTIIGVGEKISDDNIWLQIKNNYDKKGWCTSKVFLMALFP